ncbi:Uncharacterised protein [Mycobacterium tuberculosis]|nr:Uncharacterised protein [Mycobacterium tuberculosis]CNL45557.1 Uncharacterised protein [Mycobacterium tuberculosis]CNL89559.1 Uncharacterised protein [Mycobacterium tuberculosis]CNM23239.1 Uncharacterised protein [Mycobacterium tuberculosis]CNM34647.1 Uncharacterised protein [Mycobacterium tuberculosis]
MTRVTCSTAITLKTPIDIQNPRTPERLTVPSPEAMPSKAFCKAVYMSLPW